jgi:hypothetical protein
MAGSIWDWSQTAASNDDADGDINWVEGQPARTVNNSARVMMQRVAQFNSDLSARTASTGAGGTYSLTTASPFTAYADGIVVGFTANHSNTSTATLNANTLGAKPIYAAGSPLIGGEIVSGAPYTLAYDTALNSGGGGWHLMAPTVPAQVAVRLIEVDVRDTQFAGGAPLNGIDDDDEAIQAAIDYSISLGSKYDGGSVLIRLPRGRLRIGASIDMTDAHGTALRGEGRGVTQLLGTGNFPIIKSTNVAADPLYKAEVRELTIQGPGYTNVLADGIQFAANNSCVIDVQVWACRNGISLSDSWQTRILQPCVDGQGGIASNVGLYFPDGTLSPIENAVKVIGGVVQGCISHGVRAESLSGAHFMGFESVGNGGYSAYIGDSPLGGDIKWISFIGCLFDTCDRLVVLRKGSSTVAERVHFSGTWMGFPTGSTAPAFDVDGFTESTFSADMIANVTYAGVFDNCSRICVRVDTVSGFDRLAAGASAFYINDTTHSRFDLGPVWRSSGSSASWAVEEAGTSALNLISGVVSDAGVYTIPGNGSRMDGCSTLGLTGLAVWPFPDHMTAVAKANIPAASSYFAGRMLMVTDEAGGYVPAFCDGTNWRRVTDRAIVS